MNEINVDLMIDELVSKATVALDKFVKFFKSKRYS